MFPLERNASVRSRLTHSIEVQQVGCFIAQGILQRFKEQGKVAVYGLSNCETAFISFVEMSCWPNDVDNPTFGHFGGDRFHGWFNIELLATLITNPEQLTAAQQQHLEQLNQQIRQDFGHFEGNAQTSRLVHTLLQLNPSYSQVACIIK